MKSRTLGVIPARLGSTRLPDKPLFPILGRPLIEWVWRRVEAMRVLDEVVVATDSESIAAVCRKMGALVAMTADRHPSGTDRVAEVSRLDRYRDYSIIVNVQGDEPLVEEDHVAAAVELVATGAWDLATCAAPLASRAAFEDPSTVKVVRASNGRALYFSRAAIPFDRRGESDHGRTPIGAGTGSGRGSVARDGAGSDAPFGLGHIGLYVYRRAALDAWVSLDPSPLERTERLEQLRPLESGIGMGVALVERAEGGVDTPDDVARVENRLRAFTETSHAGNALT